jgi:hypothetical protein
MENYDMENITLRNCTFEFPDAPEAHLQNREVPEEGHPFPNSASFGREPFPALLFVRHVKNFKIENVKFKRNPEDKRKEYIYL